MRRRSTKAIVIGVAQVIGAALAVAALALAGAMVAAKVRCPGDPVPAAIGTTTIGEAASP